MLIFVKNREKIFLFYPLRQRRSAVRNGGRRKCLDARKASGKGTMNPENYIFLPSAGGCNAAERTQNTVLHTVNTAVLGSYGGGAIL